MSGLHVDSEVGRLRRVLLHRPDLELRRLTPANRERLLFDDVLWAERARREHDGFADALRARGVEILYLADLLSDTVAIPEARRWVLDRTAGDRTHGPALAAALRGYLEDLDPVVLARTLVGGLTRAELGGEIAGLTARAMGPGDLVLAPLPNHLFTRDTSCWIYGGVSVNPMATATRRRETVHLEAIYRFHPAFATADFTTWFGGVDERWGAATLEGGDVMVIGNRAVVTGMGQRTTPAAVELLSRALFRSGTVDSVLAVQLPAVRSYMHLDTVMTMIDRDAFVMHPGVADHARTWRLTPGNSTDEVVAVEESTAVDAIAKALELDSVRVFTTGGDEMEADREQWDDGINLLALEPGVVVAYDRNVDTNRKLRRAGIDVVTIESSELSRGRGGSRCMSCPLERDAV